MKKFCLIPQPIHASGLQQLRENGVEPLVGEAACASAPADQVVAAIYYHAARLKLKGIPFFDHP